MLGSHAGVDSSAFQTARKSADRANDDGPRRLRTWREAPRDRIVGRVPSPSSRRSLIARVRSGIRAFLLSNEPPAWFWRTPGVNQPVTSGVTVTDQSALQVTAVLSCVKVLAESISTLPLMVFERQANGDKRAAPDHPLSEILHTLANEESTAQSVRETLCAHVLLRGNAYARVVRDGGGDVREIWPIAPGCVQADRPQPGGPLVFRVSETGVPPETLRADQVWRIPGLS